MAGCYWSDDTVLCMRADDSHTSYQGPGVGIYVRIPFNLASSLSYLYQANNTHIFLVNLVHNVAYFS